MANTTVGSLNVMVGANIRGLNRGLRRGAQTIGGFASRVTQVGRTMVRFGALAAGAGVAVGSVLVKRQMAAIDANAKMADRLGLTTEALAGLHHGAELTGISTQTVNMAMQRMTRRVAEAAKGSGEAQGAIDQLGLSAESLAKMTPDQQLSVFADRLRGVEDQGERVRLAFKLFDSEGVAMLNMLQDGSAGLRRFQSEADKLNLSISREDSARVEEANDAITRLKSAVTGAARSMTIAIAPAIKTTADFLSRAIASAKQFGAGIMQAVQPVVMTIRTFVLGGWQSVLSGTIRYYAAIYGVVRSAVGAVWSVISTVLPASANTAGGAFATILRAASKLRDGVTFALNIIEFSIKNWRKVLELGMAQAALSVVRFGAEVKHFFTGVVPTLLDWFANNWKEVFITIGANTLTFFENLSSNIVGVFRNLPALISGEMSFGDIWKPLSDGFVNVIRELPEIPKRQQGALEQALQSNVEALQQSVGSDLDAFLKQKKNQADDAANAIAGFFTGGNDLFEGETPQQVGGDIAEGFNEKATAGGGDSLDLIKAGTAQAQAFAQQMARRRQNDNLDRQTAQATKKTAENTGIIARNMGRQPQPVMVNIAG